MEKKSIGHVSCSVSSDTQRQCSWCLYLAIEVITKSYIKVDQCIQDSLHEKCSLTSGLLSTKPGKHLSEGVRHCHRVRQLQQNHAAAGDKRGSFFLLIASQHKRFQVLSKELFAHNWSGWVQLGVCMFNIDLHMEYMQMECRQKTTSVPTVVLTPYNWLVIDEQFPSAVKEEGIPDFFSCC